MHTASTSNRTSTTFDHHSRESLLALLQDVLSGRARMAASDYIELVKALNRR